MEQWAPYNAALTAEQFLFYEIRIVARQRLAGQTVAQIIAAVRRDNLFQYPTERKISKFVHACDRRITALDNEQLTRALAHAPLDEAKQVNLYAMMRYNRLAREFMTDLIAEKYRQRDYAFSRKDVRMFFSRLREQNDEVAFWSDSTVTRLMQVLTKSLVEAGMLDSVKDTALNPVFISEELEAGIRANNDRPALAAFNCFR